MEGKLVVDDTEILNPGEYSWNTKEQCWYAMTPNGHLANLKNHAVLEHESGDITVTPSILVSDNHGPLWHGFLTNGIWEQC